MNNTPANKLPKITQKSHIRPPFSPFFLRTCLTNSGRYMLLQGIEYTSIAICSLGISLTVRFSSMFVV